MTLSSVRTSYTCIACIWSRTKICIKPHHKLKAPLHTKVLIKRGEPLERAILCRSLFIVTNLAFNRKQFSEKDFTLIKQEYRLKYEKCSDYYRMFYDALIERKIEIFKYIQQYYRCFMGCKSTQEYPVFNYK